MSYKKHPFESLMDGLSLTLSHSERPKLYTVLAFLNAVGLKNEISGIKYGHDRVKTIRTVQLPVAAINLQSYLVQHKSAGNNQSEDL